MFIALLLLISSLAAAPFPKRRENFRRIPYREYTLYDADEFENGLGRKLRHAGKKVERHVRHAIPHVVDTSRKVAEIGTALGYDADDLSDSQKQEIIKTIEAIPAISHAINTALKTYHHMKTNNTKSLHYDSFEEQFPFEDVSSDISEGFGSIIDAIRNATAAVKKFGELSPAEALQICSYYINTPDAEYIIGDMQPYLPYFIAFCDYVADRGYELSHIPKKYIIAFLSQILNEDFATSLVETVAYYLPAIIDNAETYSMIASKIIDVEPTEAIKILDGFLNDKAATKYVKDAQWLLTIIANAVDDVLNYFFPEN